MFGTGSLEDMSLDPRALTLSVSLILQTTALVVLNYVTYRVIRLVQYVRWTNMVFGDKPGPNEGIGSLAVYNNNNYFYILGG